MKNNNESYSRWRAALGILYVFYMPFWIINRFLADYVWFYRWLRGGHWERWDWVVLAEWRGTEWVKVETCTHIKGTKPFNYNIYKRRARKCEEHGKDVSPKCAIWCPGCDCNLFMNPDAYCDDDGKRAEILWSCSCGEWSRWLSAIGFIYLGKPNNAIHHSK